MGKQLIYSVKRAWQHYHKDMGIYSIPLVSPKYFDCSETVLTGNPSSKLWAAPPGRESLPPVTRSKRLVHWSSETW